MTQPFADANWIATGHPFDLQEVYLDFRAPVVCGQVGQVVKLRITADSRYRCWVNGVFAGRGPARSYPWAQSYDELELTGFWRDGENVIAVQVYQPGYSHFNAVHRGVAGLLAVLKVDHETALVSDQQWRCRRNETWRDDVKRVSIYGTGVEWREVVAGGAWQAVGFDDSSWEQARVVAPPEGVIWDGLHARETPLAQERKVWPPLVRYRVGGWGKLSADPHLDLAAAWASGDERPGPDHTDGWFQPQLKDQSCALFLFDLGSAHTCQGIAEVEGAAGGEMLSISYLDKDAGGEPVLSDPETYCRVRLTDRFVIGPGAHQLESFSPRGGRYVLFQLAGNLSDAFRIRFSVRLFEYPLALRPRPVWPDEQLQQIVTMCERTMLACLQDSFVDCVWRESSQWLGDGLVQSHALWAMSADLRPLRKLLFDSAAGQYPDGLVPSVAAGEVHAYTIPRYGCMWVELLAFLH